MKKLFLLLLLYVPLLSLGSNPFVKYISGNNGYADASMIRLSPNQFVIAANDTIIQFNSIDNYLVSVDSSGNVLWSVKRTGLSGVHIAAFSADSFVCASSIPNSFNSLLDVYDKSGNLLRSVVTSLTEITTMITTLDGGIFIGSYATVIKLDGNLNYQWGQWILHTYDPVFDLCQFADSSYAYAGSGVNANDNLDNGAFTRFDKNGTPYLTRFYRGTYGVLSFAQVVPMANNRTLFVADFLENNCFNDHSGSDIFLVDALGNIVRDFHPPCLTSSVDKVYAASVLQEKIIMLVRTTDSLNEKVALMQIDTLGSLQSIMSLPIDAMDSHAYTMISDHDNVYFSCNANGAIVFGKTGLADTLDCIQSENAFVYDTTWITPSSAGIFSFNVATVTNYDTISFSSGDVFTDQDLCVVLGINSTSHRDGFEIYPNPVRNSFRISTAEAEFILIHDITGKCIKRVEITSDKMEISVSDLSDGIYFVSLQDKSISGTQRLVVIH